jgi:hypothetical protein
MDRRPPRDVTRKLVTGLAIVTAVILTVGGLAAIGAYVLVVIAMSNFGSNK